MLRASPERSDHKYAFKPLTSVPNSLYYEHWLIQKQIIKTLTIFVRIAPVNSRQLIVSKNSSL